MAALPFPHPTTLPPGFVMSRVTPADVPEMADIWSYTYWWSPSAEAMRAWNEERIRRRLRDPATHMFKIVDTTSPAQQSIVAWAKWDVPVSMAGRLREGFILYDDDDDDDSGHRKTAAEGVRSLPDPPEGADIPLMNEIFDGVRRMEEKWRAGEMLCLTHICTRPAYHGRGLGSVLLRSGLDAADAAGVPTYLEALRLARPLYERHGFTAVDRLVVNHGRAAVEIMVRAGGNGER
ncbi:acyl-CoA N-acyltransferase [Camillea tinctor]|nr:acyl-CoA N-acyltransferase [Camillea tinctor]